MPRRLKLQDQDRDVVVEISATRNGPEATATSDTEVRFEDGSAALVRTGTDGRYEVLLQGGAGDDVATGADREFTVVAVPAGDSAWVQIAGELFEFRGRTGERASASQERDALSPPMAARVARVLVTAGQAVREGDLLIALEAMKMELPIRAPRDAMVVAVHCREGDMVAAGASVVELGDRPR